MLSRLIVLLCSLFPVLIFAQLEVSGLVSDEAGEPLIGVAIRLGNSGQGTLTGIDGRFSLVIKEADEESKLLLTYTGMETLVYPLKQAQIVTDKDGKRQAVLQLVMQETSLQIKQVVVTAYRGAQERKDLVGSHEAVQLEELMPDRPEESIDKLLEGRIAGVQVNITTGEPGLPVQVQIRGQGSLPNIGAGVSASTQPLFVLDGVPLFDVSETNTATSVFADINSQRLNPLSFLNMEDIESITVLKDASATALYGADAANGVVLITTKSAKAGEKQSINLSYSQGFANPLDEIKYLNSQEYVELARETLFNSGRNPADAGTSDIFTDWRALVQRTSTTRNVDFSMSGSSKEGLAYRFSAGYNQLQGAHIGNGLEQLNFSLKVEAPAFKNLQMGIRINGGSQKRDGLSTYNAFSYLPNLPVRLPDGSFNNGGFFINRPNPLAALEQNENVTNSKSFNSQMSLNYQAARSLNFRFLAGIDFNDSEQFQYNSALNGSGATRNGSLRMGQRENSQWVSNLQGTWSPTFGASAHHLSVLGGGELNGQVQKQLVATGANFPFDDLRQLRFLQNEDTRISESVFERKKASLYGEISYNYNYRYYIKFNGRRDASSIFGGDQQAQLLWAIGSSWNISEENWWASQPLGISYAKLRTSYGITGNSRIGVYSARGLYRFNDVLYEQQVPLTASSPINDFLGWERKKQLNLALDLTFGEYSPFRFTLEWYNNTTIDAITSAEVPLESGFENVIANAASIRNRGVELSINYGSKEGKKWAYKSSFNIARNYNTLLSINVEDLPSTTGNPRAFRVGQDVNTLYAIVFAGVDPATGQELFQLADGSISDETAPTRDFRNYVPVGNSTPDFFGGWFHSLKYKQFTLASQLNFSYGGARILSPLTFQDGRQILINNQSVNQLDRWQQPGDITDTPRPSIDKPLVSRSTRYLQQLNFLQIASVSLNYSINNTGSLPDFIRQITLFALVNNLYYFYDEPRRKNRNTVAEYRFNFPQQRALVFGVKVKL